MHMQMENVLACGFAVLLDDADAVGVCGFFNWEGYLFSDLMHMA